MSSSGTCRVQYVNERRQKNPNALPEQNIGVSIADLVIKHERLPKSVGHARDLRLPTKLTTEIERYRQP